MKRMVCELCGSNSFIKTEGKYVCQGCGCAFTPEEARALLHDEEGAELESYLWSDSNSLASGQSNVPLILTAFIKSLRSELWEDSYRLLETLSENDPSNPYVSVFTHICQAAMQREISEISSAGAAFENAKGDAYERWGVSDELKVFCMIFSASIAKVFPIAGESMVETLIECRKEALGVNGLFARANALSKYSEIAVNSYKVLCKLGGLMIQSITNAALALNIGAAVACDAKSLYQYLDGIDSRIGIQDKYNFAAMRDNITNLSS